MEENFRVLEESGYKEVERQKKILIKNGYRIKGETHGLVPFCEGKDGLPVMLPGWTIITERPPLREVPRRLWE